MFIRPVETSRELGEFIDFPYRLHADNPNWVPPLISIQKKRILNERSNPFFSHAKVKHFLAYKNNKVSGRISAIIDDNYNSFHGSRTGFFGFFECIDCQDTANRIFSTVIDYLKGHEMDTLMGPINLSTNNECGLLIKGHDLPPVIMMTYHPRYYHDLISNSGFSKAMDIYAYLLTKDDVGENIKKLCEYVTIPEEYTFRTIRKKHLKSEIALIKDIYNSAWEDNWGFVPLTSSEFDYLAEDLKHIVDEDLVFIVEKGKETVGFSLALPDINQILINMRGRLLPFGFLKVLFNKRKVNTIRVITMGVKKEHRKTGIAPKFYLKTIENALRKGYTRAECSWVLENNRAMNRDLRVLGANKYKTYRIFHKPLCMQK